MYVCISGVLSFIHPCVPYYLPTYYPLCSLMLPNFHLFSNYSCISFWYTHAEITCRLYNQQSERTQMFDEFQYFLRKLTNVNEILNCFIFRNNSYHGSESCLCEHYRNGNLHYHRLQYM